MPDHAVIHTHCAASPAQDILLDYPGPGLFPSVVLEILTLTNTPFADELLGRRCGQYELSSDPPDTWRTELSQGCAVPAGAVLEAL